MSRHYRCSTGDQVSTIAGGNDSAVVATTSEPPSTTRVNNASSSATTQDERQASTAKTDSPVTVENTTLPETTVTSSMMTDTPPTTAENRTTPVIADPPTTNVEANSQPTTLKMDSSTVASSNPSPTSEKNDPPTTISGTDLLTTTIKTDPPTTAVKTITTTDPPSAILGIDSTTVSSTNPPTTTIPSTDLPKTIVETDIPTSVSNTEVLTTVKTDLPTIVLSTAPPASALKTDLPATVASTDPPATAVKTDLPTTVLSTAPPATPLKTELPTTVASTDPPTAVKTDLTTTVASTDPPTAVKTDLLTTVASTDPPTTAVKTDLPTTVLSTAPPATALKTELPTTVASTDPPTAVKTGLPTTVASTDPPTALKTDLLTTVASTDPPTAVKTDLLTTVASTDPPTALKTDLPATVASTDPPTTAVRTDLPTTVLSTAPPATALKNELPTTVASTDPPTAVKTDLPTTVASTDPPTAVKTDLLTTVASTDPPTAVKTDFPTTVASTDPPTAVKTDLLTTVASTDPPTAVKTDFPTTVASTDPPTTAVRTDLPTTIASTDPTTAAVKTGLPTTVASTDPSTTAVKTDLPTTVASTDPPTTAVKTVPSATTLNTEQQVTTIKTSSTATGIMTGQPAITLRTDPQTVTTQVTSQLTSTNASGLTTTGKADTFMTTTEIDLTTTIVKTDLPTSSVKPDLPIVTVRTGTYTSAVYSDLPTTAVKTDPSTDGVETGPLTATLQTELTTKLLVMNSATSTEPYAPTTTDIPVTSLKTDPETTVLTTYHPSTTVKAGVQTTVAKATPTTTVVKTDDIKTTETSVPPTTTKMEVPLTTTMKELAISTVKTELPTTSVAVDWPTATLKTELPSTSENKDQSATVSSAKSELTTTAEKVDVQTTTSKVNLPLTTVSYDTQTTTVKDETTITASSTDLQITTVKTESYTTAIDTQVPTTDPPKTTLKMESPTNAITSAPTTDARTNSPTVFDKDEPTTLMKANIQPTTIMTSDLTTTLENHGPTHTTDNAMPISTSVPGSFSETSSTAKSTLQHSGPLEYISTVTTTAIRYVTDLVSNSPLSSEASSANTETESLTHLKNTASLGSTSPVTQLTDSTTTASPVVAESSSFEPQPLTAPPTVIITTHTSSTTSPTDHVSSIEATQQLRSTSLSATQVSTTPTTVATQKPITPPLASVSTSTTTSTTTSATTAHSTTRKASTTTTTSTTTTSTTTTTTSPSVKSSSTQDTSTLASLVKSSTSYVNGNTAESENTQTYTSLVSSHTEVSKNSTSSTSENVTTTMIKTDQGTVITNEPKEPERSSTLPFSSTHTNSLVKDTTQSMPPYSTSPAKSEDAKSDLTTPSTTHNQPLSTLEFQHTTRETFSPDISTSNAHSHPTSSQTVSRYLSTTVATPADITSTNNPTSLSSSQNFPSSASIPQVILTSTESQDERTSAVTSFVTTASNIKVSVPTMSAFTSESTAHSGLSKTTTIPEVATSPNLLPDSPSSASLPPVILTSTESSETKTSAVTSFVTTASDFKVSAPTTSEFTTHKSKTNPGLGHTTTIPEVTTFETTALLPTRNNPPLTMTTVTTKEAAATTTNQPKTRESSATESSITSTMSSISPGKSPTPAVTYSLENTQGSTAAGISSSDYATLAMTISGQQNTKSSENTENISERTEKTTQAMPSGTTLAVKISDTSYMDTKLSLATTEHLLPTTDVQLTTESLTTNSKEIGIVTSVEPQATNSKDTSSSDSQPFTVKSTFTSNSDLLATTYQLYKSTKSSPTTIDGPYSSMDVSKNSSLGNLTTLPVTTEVTQTSGDSSVSERQSSALDFSTATSPQTTKQKTSSSTTTTPKIRQITSTTSTTTRATTSTTSAMSGTSKISSKTKVVTQSITPTVTKELTLNTRPVTSTEPYTVTELLTGGPTLANNSFSTVDQLHSESFTNATFQGTETSLSSTTELSTQTDSTSTSEALMTATSNSKVSSTSEFQESSITSESSLSTDWASDSSSVSDSSTTELASSTEPSTELTQYPITTSTTTTPVPTMPIYHLTSTTSTTSTTTASSTVKAKTPVTGASRATTASRSVSNNPTTFTTDIATSTTELFLFSSTVTADNIQSSTETETTDLSTATDFSSTTDNYASSTTETSTASTETDSTTYLPTTTMLQTTTTTTLPPVILTTQSTTTTSSTTRSTSTTSTTDSTTEVTSTTPETSALSTEKPSETDFYTSRTEVPTNEIAATVSSTTVEQAATSTMTSESTLTPMAQEVTTTAVPTTDTTPTTTLPSTPISVTATSTTTKAITTMKPGISFINLTADSAIMKTNTKYNFTVQVESYYQTSCTVNYGDGTRENVQAEPPLPLLRFSHSYADESEGRLWVEASCQDTVSEVRTGLWVDVVKPLLGFNLTYGPKPLPIPSGLATFTLSFPGQHYKGQAINMSYDFGDGNTEFHRLSGNDTQGGVFMVLHTYQFSSTPLTASVILANKAGSVRVLTRVNMEQMITGATLKVVGPPRAELHSEIRFHLTLVTGSNVRVTVNFGDGIVRTVAGFNGTVITHIFTSEGNYSVVAEMRNNVSMTTYELPGKILARRSLHDMDLQTRTHAALPLGEFPMVLLPSHNHKDVKCVFDMGHEVFERFFPFLEAGSEVNIDYSYAGVAPGIYQMVVNCSNNISTMTFQEEIVIVELIDSLQLNVKPLFTQVGDVTVIKVSIAMGSNITYVVSFGNGVIETRGDSSLNVTFRYAYNTSGTFVIRASAVNYLSQAQDTATISVVEAIEGASFNHHSIDLYSGRIYHGTGPDHNMFNVDRKLVLTANTTSGSNLVYYWELDDGTSKETFTTKTAHLLKKYYAATNVTAVVTITNGIMNVTEVMHAILREPAAIGSFTNDGPVRAMKNITFTLTIRNPSPTTCVLLKVSEETVLHGREVCETIYASHSFVDQSYTYIREPLLETMHFVEMYEKEGLTSVDVTVFNWVSRSFAVSQAAISRAECKYPLVKIFGRGQDVEAPQVTTVTEQVVVEAMVKVHCEYSDRASFTWSLRKTVTKGESLGSYRNTLMNASLSEDVRTLQPKVVFPPHYFAPDTLYNVSLSVVMLDMPEIATTDSFYIYVKSRPLEINFLNGNARAIGYNKKYTIDVVSRSRDPDAPLALQRDFSTWRFVWLCYRKGEPEPHPDYSPLIDIPAQPVNITVYNDRGGCFGSGPGRLNVSDTKSVLNFNSRNSLLNSTLTFVVQVTTPTKTKKAYQRVEILKGDPPEIVIRCMSNCQVKVNPNDTYAILGRCLTCDAQGITVTYNWTLYEFNSTTERFQLVTDLHRMAPGTGVGGRSINIKEGELAAGRCYRIQLAGSSHYTSTAYTQLDFCTTRPPFGGNCSVSPEVGIVLETGFSVTCDRWINPETETSAGLKYQVWSQVQGRTDPPVLLSASPHPEVHNLVFGPGEEAYNYTHLVSVYISHEMGAYTVVHRSLRVEPLRMNADEMNNFMHSASEDLKGLMSSGDSQKGFQKASAMGSLLNSALKADTSNMTEEELAAAARQQEEERKNMRATLIDVVGSSKVYTLDAIQQCSGAISTVTKVATEVSEDSQRNTVKYMSDMAGSLTRFTEGNKGEPPSMKTTVDAATGLIASVANAGKAAALSYRNTVAKANDLLSNLTDWNSTNDFLFESTTTTMIPTTTDSIATTTLIATTAAAVEDATNLVRDVTTGMMSVSATVAGAVLTNQVPGQAPVTIQSEVFDLIAGRTLAESLGNTSTRAGSGGFKLPSVGSLGTSKKPDFLDQKAMSMSENPFVWGSGASNLRSAVVSLTLGDGKGNDLEIKDTDEDIIIEVDIDPANVPEPVEFSPFVRRDATWDNTHVINVANNNSAIYLVLRPDSDNATFEVLIRYGERADDVNYDLAYQIPRNLSEEDVDDLSPEDEDEMTYSIFVSPDFIEYHGTGDYYVRVKQQVNFSLETDYSYEEPAAPTTLSPVADKEVDIFSMDDYVYPWYEEPPNPYDYIDLANYTLQTITPICRFWNSEAESWDTDGCRVTPATNTRMVRCACNHLTSFGSDFFVPPNTIDFGSVYDNLGAKLKDNFAVLVTICVLLALYVLVGIWARYKDKQDVKKWGVTALADNLAGEKYLYLLTVMTGMKGKSGTASNISFVLSGTDEDTGVRKLSDDKRKEHTRGSSVQYVMSTEGPLGDPTYLRIWHDNSGKNDKAGWYLDRFTVSDLQTGKTFAFIVNRWLAVDEDDGQIDRLVPVATPEDITAFRNLFVNTSKKNLTDGHLWVSIFVRPYKSTYTRVQRLSVVVSVTFLTMVVNAMFYKSEPVRTTKLELGFMTVTTFQLWVSIMGTLIVIPPSVANGPDI
ncbi:serine-rich adhesin for platelets-like [Macrobrachium rosenbergii]|uniref:serine-rich adhesin for platelets-like n=1 Tax=Macrobrachium rosenbergii TaxID=79674 RepID=UPI0034D78447